MNKYQLQIYNPATRHYQTITESRNFKNVIWTINKPYNIKYQRRVIKTKTVTITKLKSGERLESEIENGSDEAHSQTEEN